MAKDFLFFKPPTVLVIHLTQIYSLGQDHGAPIQKNITIPNSGPLWILNQRPSFKRSPGQWSSKFSPPESQRRPGSTLNITECQLGAGA